ncbi:hypothetical protein D1007_17513 [Hordeum vulgare]|nr:hypothetical protein D1007_17513 [Hordeum vulgare]
MGSSTHARMERVNAHAALLMACELLRYRPTDTGYDVWLTRITQLDNTAGETPAHYCSLRTPPSHDNEEAQGAAPPPTPACGGRIKPGCGAHPGSSPREPPPRAEGDGDTSQIVHPEPPMDACAVLEQ